MRGDPGDPAARDDPVDVTGHIADVRRRALVALLWVAAAALALTALGVGSEGVRATTALVGLPVAVLAAVGVRSGRLDVHRVEIAVALVVAALFAVAHTQASMAVLPAPDTLDLLDIQFREFRVLAVLTVLGFYVFATRAAWAYVLGVVAALAVVRASTVGFVYPARAHQQAALANAGQLVAFLVILTYLAAATEWLGEGRRRLDAALANRRRIQAAVAHDIISPLTAATGLVTTVLQRPGLDDARRDALLERAAEAVERVVGIAQDLLRDVGIVGRERPTLVRLDRLLDAAVEQSRLRSSPIVLVAAPEWVLLPEHSAVRGLVNLLDNADRHGRPPVHASAVVEEGHVVLRVHDHGEGAGLDGDDLFEPFVRGDGPGEGTGLGLHVLTEIARTHDGTVRVADVDVGTAVELRLPVERGDPEDAAADGQVEQGRGRGTTVSGR